MNRNLVLVAAVIAVVSTALTLLLASVLIPNQVAAQQSSPSVDGIVFLGYHRKDTDKSQGFIFYDQKTGDIWVYDDEDVKEHYRVTQLGQNLEKISK